MTLSVVINTLNEESNIRDCLECVTWADEIIIVDMHSDDRTVEIARKYTNKIYSHERVGFVEPARNFAIQQATGDWILIIDADERVSPELQAEIQEILQTDSEYVSYRIPMREYMFGRWIDHGNWKYEKLLRLFRSGTVKWPTKIHGQPTLEGKMGLLRESLAHYSHLTVGRFIKKLNQYTDVEAQQWYEKGEHRGLIRAAIGGIIRFCKEYILFQGFRDGGHGFILAILMAVYDFAAGAKLWVLWYKHNHHTP